MMCCCLWWDDVFQMVDCSKFVVDNFWLNLSIVVTIQCLKIGAFMGEAIIVIGICRQDKFVKSLTLLMMICWCILGLVYNLSRILLEHGICISSEDLQSRCQTGCIYSTMVLTQIFSTVGLDMSCNFVIIMVGSGGLVQGRREMRKMRQTSLFFWLTDSTVGIYVGGPTIFVTIM